MAGNFAETAKKWIFVLVTFYNSINIPTYHLLIRRDFKSLVFVVIRSRQLMNKIENSVKHAPPIVKCTKRKKPKQSLSISWQCPFNLETFHKESRKPIPVGQCWECLALPFYWGDTVNSGIGLSYRHAKLYCYTVCTWLAGRYDNLCRSWLYPPIRDLRIRLLIVEHCATISNYFYGGNSCIVYTVRVYNRMPCTDNGVLSQHTLCCCIYSCSNPFRQYRL
jgi:hypothetical protein